MKFEIMPVISPIQAAPARLTLVEAREWLDERFLKSIFVELQAFASDKLARFDKLPAKLKFAIYIEEYKDKK